jgi:salicylate hydroxylase
MYDGPEQEARDAILRAPIKAPYPSRWSCPQVQSWLYGYDAFEEVKEAVAENPFEANKPALDGSRVETEVPKASL